MNAPDLFDDLLEISIVGSFSRPGFLARRTLRNWTAADPDALTGHTVLITGPTSGLGRAAATALADLGARIILLGRSEERLQGVRKALVERTGEDRYRTVVADMSSLASVRSAVAQISATEARLDVLIDNAGAINEERVVTEDGIEATFATMVAGPFALIDGLLPLLEASGDGRVVTVVSGGMYLQSLPIDDLQFERGEYNGTLAYARAKRAATALIREWSRRYHGRVRFDAMHPGWADTPGLAESLPAFHGAMGPLLRTPAEGVDTITWLATERDIQGPDGRLYLDRRARPFDRLRSTRLSASQRRRLWDEVVRLTDAPGPEA